MSAHFANQNVTFFAVPKCATRSIKHMLHEAEHGAPFDREAQPDGPSDLLRVYPPVSFKRAKEMAGESGFKFAVVRDPLDRIIALWQDKVVRGKCLDEDKFEIGPADAGDGVVYNPDFNRFAKLLRNYRSLSPAIKRHSNSYSFHLGRKAEYFDKIYNIENLDKLCADLAGRGMDVPDLRHVGLERKEFDKDDLDQDAAAMVRGTYASDIATFKAWL